MAALRKLVTAPLHRRTVVSGYSPGSLSLEKTGFSCKSARASITNQKINLSRGKRPWQPAYAELKGFFNGQENQPEYGRTKIADASEAPSFVEAERRGILGVVPPVSPGSAD